MSQTQDRREQARKKLRQVEGGKLLPRNHPLATAFHEGAHAVFMEGFGMSIVWATCYPCEKDGEKLLGYVKTDEDELLTGPQDTVVTLAGDIAEYPLIHGREYEFGGMTGSDAEQIEKVWKACGTELFTPQSIGSLEQISKTAAQLVHQTKEYINSVAIELYALKTIQGEHIRAILKESGFYTPQNPLLEYYMQTIVMRMLYIAKESGITLPAGAEDGSLLTEDLMKWFLGNALVLGPLLLDKNAKWNRRAWGNSPGRELSTRQIEQLASCSDISKRFGVPLSLFRNSESPQTLSREAAAD